jgi:hypothetical protein
MKLHEAIIAILKRAGKALTTTEITNKLNETGLYKKKDGSPITPYQIHGRTKNYSHLFGREGTKVFLLKSDAPQTKTLKPRVIPNSINTYRKENVGLDTLFINENFQSPSQIAAIVPSQPGIYCIRIRSIDQLPNSFKTHLKQRGHDILYIGIASQSLRKRFFEQELNAKGHGTFFRSLGAILGYLPPKGSLLSKKNKRNYKFSASDESKIIAWIKANLLVNWVVISGDHENVESELILKHKPLLNLAKNPHALSELSTLRARCVEVANS